MPRAAVIVGNQASKCSSPIVRIPTGNLDRLSTVGSCEREGGANKKEGARQSHCQG
jgi:hypothetical protein